MGLELVLVEWNGNVFYLESVHVLQYIGKPDSLFPDILNTN